MEEVGKLTGSIPVGRDKHAVTRSVKDASGVVTTRSGDRDASAGTFCEGRSRSKIHWQEPGGWGPTYGSHRFYTIQSVRLI